ncbi:MAG: hypothetical protein HOE80_01975 [Candidatus Magasanikbacteria bacterium]|jgi:hypothetical protein|nr:hypothetical protein [Candidatus Magasanikbacteria bacterium]MBT4071469.1 hypothetical protein [Candidatus Magasanikbacteria bacterium]
MDVKKHPERRVLHIISIPFIYAAAIPVVILDIFTEIYHRVCFPLYNISYIKRSKYIKIDRPKLSYLNPFDKVNCMYCGYVNGFAAYFVAICGATEKYWCGIKHEGYKDLHMPEHHKEFLEYGDKKEYKNMSK